MFARGLRGGDGSKTIRQVYGQRITLSHPAALSQAPAGTSEMLFVKRRFDLRQTVDHHRHQKVIPSVFFHRRKFETGFLVCIKSISETIKLERSQLPFGS